MKKFIAVALIAILASCASSPPTSKQERLLAVVRGVGEPLLLLHGYALVEEHAPELLPLLDKNNDKVLSMVEVETAVRSIDEAMATLLLAQVVSRLVAK